MAKKVAVWGGAGVALLLIIGGVFLFLGRKKDASYTSIPTTWSQEGDYDIKTEGTKTTVTNTKAGYSFEVPEGWKVEKSEGSAVGEVMLNLLDPDTTFDDKKRLIKGCFASLETIFQKDEVFSVQTLIASTTREKNQEEKEIVTIRGKQALKQFLVPKNEETRRQMGEIIRLQFPMSEVSLLDFWMRFMLEQKTQCLDAFDRLSNSILLL